MLNANVGMKFFSITFFKLYFWSGLLISILNFQIKSLVISLSKKRTKLKSDCWTELLAYLFLLLQFFSKKARNEHAFFIRLSNNSWSPKKHAPVGARYLKKEGLTTALLFLIKVNSACMYCNLTRKNKLRTLRETVSQCSAHYGGDL